MSKRYNLSELNLMCCLALHPDYELPDPSILSLNGQRFIKSIEQTRETGEQGNELQEYMKKCRIEPTNT